MILMIEVHRKIRKLKILKLNKHKLIKNYKYM